MFVTCLTSAMYAHPPPPTRTRFNVDYWAGKRKSFLKEPISKEEEFWQELTFTENNNIILSIMITFQNIIPSSIDLYFSFILNRLPNILNTNLNVGTYFNIQNTSFDLKRILQIYFWNLPNSCHPFSYKRKYPNILSRESTKTSKCISIFNKTTTTTITVKTIWVLPKATVVRAQGQTDCQRQNTARVSQ